MRDTVLAVGMMRFSEATFNNVLHAPVLSFKPHHNRT